MRIGLVINILNEEYQISVFKGIKKRTEEQEINLICFQDENKKFEFSPFIGEKIGKAGLNLDGIILLTSVLTSTYGIQKKEDLEKIWGNIPVVSVGQKIEGIPSLLIETDNSMKQLVEHLLLEHKYRNFVYLSGAEDHHDAIKREYIFKKTMDAYKPWFADLKYTIKRGWFEEETAIEAMKEYYEENPGENPDVVVCANDNMALGVYKFYKMNRDNPNIRECAVTGFDDIPQGRFVVSPLTTIHQPLEEMGDAAVSALLNLIAKKKMTAESFIESKIIFRNSCGCKMVSNTIELAEEIQAGYINSEEMLKNVSTIGRDLNMCESEKDLTTIINRSAEQIDIKNFCVLSFINHNQTNKTEEIFENVKPVYVRRNGISILNQENSSFGEFVKNYLELDNKPPHTLVVKILNSGNDIIGAVLYDAPDKMLRYLIPIATSISQAMVRIETMEERKRRSEYLEKEVTKRTKQLIESNSKRLEVEAEVLKISELERQRFSTDLHDDICQRLAGISMLCRSYSKLNSGVKKEQMEELAVLISDTLQTTRQYAHNSYPVELESLGMDHSISNLCNSFEKQSGIECNYEWSLESDSIFDKVEKLNIFRIIQEALHNIIKHSKAEHVTVSVKKTSKNVVIKIIDDGCGIDKNSIDSNGIGLNSMQYRANQIGASFKIKQNKPKGTCVEVTVKK